MTAEMSLTLKLMGHFQCLVEDARLTPAEDGLKPCALLAYLAMETSLGGVRRLSRLHLADLFWPLSANEQRARNSLSQALHRLRKSLGDTSRPPDQYILCSDINSVWLNHEVVLRLDVIDFLRCLRKDEREELTYGLTLYRKQFLADIDLGDCPEFGDWQTHHQNRLQAEALSARSALTEICISQGDWQAALGNAYKQLELDRTTEGAYRQLMRIRAYCGEREAAINLFGHCIEVLHSELGVEPERATVEIYDSIVDGTFPLDTPALQTPFPSAEHAPAIVGGYAEEHQWKGVVDVHGAGLEIITGYDLWFTCQATGRWQIWHLDSTVGIPKPVTFELTPSLAGADQFAPAVSPDGTLLVFAGGKRIQGRLFIRNLYLADLASKRARRLTTSALDDYRPVWFPHGNLLAYHAGLARTEHDPGIAFGIHVLDLQTGQPQQLTDQMDYDPCWSPSGSYIAYHSLHEGCTVKIIDYTARLAAGEASTTWSAANSGLRATSPCWINDHRIVYACLCDAQWQIFSIPVKPYKTYHNPDQLTYSDRNHVYPRVFDSRIMLWQAFPHEPAADEGDATDKDAEIWVMDLEGRVETPLVTGIGNIRDGFLVRQKDNR